MTAVVLMKGKNMKKDKKLSDLQVRILDILWENGSLSIQEVKNILDQERVLAATTIATILKRLEKQGFVKFSKIGRKFIYSANIAKDEVTKTSISSLVKNLFKGNKAALVSHLLAEELSLDELEHIQTLIQEKVNNNV